MTLSKNIVVFGKDDRINKQIDKLKEEYEFAQWRVKEYDNPKTDLSGFIAWNSFVSLSVYGCDLTKNEPYSWDVAYIDDSLDKMWVSNFALPRRNDMFSELHFF